MIANGESRIYPIINIVIKQWSYKIDFMLIALLDHYTI